jgi:hypothetical protein
MNWFWTWGGGCPGRRRFDQLLACRGSRVCDFYNLLTQGGLLHRDTFRPGPATRDHEERDPVPKAFAFRFVGVTWHLCFA